MQSLVTFSIFWSKFDGPFDILRYFSCMLQRQTVVNLSTKFYDRLIFPDPQKKKPFSFSMSFF